MREVVVRLVHAYRRELELYGDVLELARRGAELARERQPLPELREINDRKRALLGQIESIESTIAEDKDVWRADGVLRSEGRELEELLRRLTDRIEDILRAERDTDRRIVESSAMEASPDSLSERG